MTWSPPPDEIFVMSLPAEKCSACGAPIARRSHRVWIRASWRPSCEPLCPGCWAIICQWAARFALMQTELELGI